MNKREVSAGMQELLRSAAQGSIALSCFQSTDSSFTARAFLPLVEHGRVVFALPYAEASTAQQLATAPTGVVLVLADGRLAGRQWAPLAAAGHVRVVEDPRGERFSESLMTQELRKHPPSRALIDSPLLRREHWWYVSRLLAVFEPDRMWPVAPLSTDEGVLAWQAGPGLEADTVAVEAGIDGWEGPEVVLKARPAGCRDSRVLLCRHDFSVPDREVSSTLIVQGTLDGRRLRVTARQGNAALPPAPGLLARVRSERALERRCRAGLAAAGGTRGPLRP